MIGTPLLQWCSLLYLVDNLAAFQEIEGISACFQLVCFNLQKFAIWLQGKTSPLETSFMVGIGKLHLTSSRASRCRHLARGFPSTVVSAGTSGTGSGGQPAGTAPPVCSAALTLPPVLPRASQSSPRACLYIVAVHRLNLCIVCMCQRSPCISATSPPRRRQQEPMTGRPSGFVDPVPV